MLARAWRCSRLWGKAAPLKLLKTVRASACPSWRRNRQFKPRLLLQPQLLRLLLPQPQCQRVLPPRRRPSLSSNFSPTLNHCRLHQRQQHRLQWQLSCH